MVVSAGAASYPNASTSAKRSMLVPATRLLMHFFTKSMPAVASAGSSFHLKSKSEEQNISSIQVQDKSLFIINYYYMHVEVLVLPPGCQ